MADFFLGPELNKSTESLLKTQENNPKRDIWSVGIFTGLALSGKLFSNYSKGEVNFSEDIWQSVSKTAKNFIRTLLVHDPDHRPSAAQALQHNWLTRRKSVKSLKAKPLPNTVNDNLK